MGRHEGENYPKLCPFCLDEQGGCEFCIGKNNNNSY